MTKQVLWGQKGDQNRNYSVLKHSAALYNLGLRAQHPLARTRFIFWQHKHQVASSRPIFFGLFGNPCHYQHKKPSEPACYRQATGVGVWSVAIKWSVFLQEGGGQATKII